MSWRDSRFWRTEAERVIPDITDSFWMDLLTLRHAFLRAVRHTGLEGPTCRLNSAVQSYGRFRRCAVNTNRLLTDRAELRLRQRFKLNAAFPADIADGESGTISAATDWSQTTSSLANHEASMACYFGGDAVARNQVMRHTFVTGLQKPNSQLARAWLSSRSSAPRLPAAWCAPAPQRWAIRATCFA